MDELKEVTIYTDGACIKNPGPGGYGVVLLYKGHRKELSGGFRKTTNNRMEIMAATVGLQALTCPCEVRLYTDSQYLTEAVMKGWARRWRQNGWMRTKAERACNRDLWQELLDACATHQVTVAWVRGHAGDPENERCDRLAAAAARKQGLPPDEVYEKEKAALGAVPLFDAGPMPSPTRESHGPLCAVCGVPIPTDRLNAMPGATLCVTCQRGKESAQSDERLTDLECPHCAQRGIKSRLVWRVARDPTVPGYFLGCSRYPSCHYVERA